MSVLVIEKDCRKCGESLADGGIYTSRIKRHDWICKECCKDINKHYHRSKAKKRQEDQTDGSE